jgi:antitoxin component YwqK of YwqJK toxin-antitoxin module
MKALKINPIRHSLAIIALLLVSFAPLCMSAQSQVPDGVYPNTIDTNGFKQGAWKKLDDQGTCVYVGQFKNDKPYGTFKYFDTDGRLMTEMNFMNGGPVSYGKMYGVSGKVQAEGKYVNQLKDSLWKFYTEDGLLLSEEMYLKGKKDGKSITYHPGTKQAAEIKTFKNGLEQGAWIEYYLDGAKEAEGTYLDGNYDGKAVWYFPDGRINIIGNYQHAVKDGIWTYYGIDEKGNYAVKGTETWKLGKLMSGEQVIKTDDFNKQVDDPQDPNHDAGSDQPH